LRDGSYSCVDVVQSFLDSIDRTQPLLNAFVTVERASAIRVAALLDRELRRGHSRGPLHGIPVAVKDLIAVAGLPLRAGSSVYHHRSKTDARVIRDLRRAGAVVLGLTRLHEIALAPTGLNPHDGGARNPHDLGRIPGGSSSGSAVAVAAHLSPLALGTDTGGSVRIPAALCGVVGFKPTYGLLSTTGVMPLAPTLDHVGLFARSVADIRTTLVALGVLRRRQRSYLSRCRFGVLVGAAQDLHPPVLAAYDRCLTVLRDAGGDVVEFALEGSESVIEASSTILFYEAYRVHRSRFRVNPMAFGSDIRQRLLDGRSISRARYLAALRTKNQLQAASDAAFENIAFMVSPTVPVLALPIAEAGEAARRGLLTRNTRLLNVLGIPAISIPAPSDSLPIGLQIAARRGADGELLAVTEAIEQALRQAGPGHPKTGS